MHAYFYQNLSTAPKPPFRRHPFPWWSRLSLSSTVSLHRLTTVLTGRNFLSTAFVFALKPLFSSGMRLRGGRARGSLISIPGQLCPLSRASHPFSTDSIHLFRGSPFRKTTPLFATVLCRSFDLLTKGFSRERERGRKVCVSLFLSKAYSRSFRPVASLEAVYPASRVYHIRAPCSRARVYLVLHTTAVRDCVPCGERRS